ncbi:MAG: phenylacetate--CoA ligase family protein [Alphaproteobacteria bacterium]|jgi:phenylacetate-CoA ligase|nr:phenylacetate--CoA ligase family protein [Alphaproteobacteria bacterium]
MRRDAKPRPGSRTFSGKSPYLVRSVVPGIEWPGLPDQMDASVLAIEYQLRRSLWWPTSRLAEQQRRQRDLLVGHAARTVPFYRERLAVVAGAGAQTISDDQTISDELWRRIPIVTRADLRNAGSTLESRKALPSHGRRFEIRSSGTTGRPVTVQGTALTTIMSRALNLRDHLWHKRDMRATAALIRRLDDKVDEGGDKAARWAFGADSGPLISYDIARPVKNQVAWLRTQEPAYLMTHPSNLRAIIDACREGTKDLPSLREVDTFGEPVDDSLRAETKQVLGVPLVDSYSAEETGPLALQCPDCECYLVQSEAVQVEVVDDAGEPSRYGDTGRVVVTALHNYATPLVRYEIGDCAEPAAPCDCGRGLPRLRAIPGRVRNMMILPSGDKIRPPFAIGSLTRMFALEQAQFVQTAIDRLEALLVAPRAWTAEEEEAFRREICQRLGQDFAIELKFVAEIPFPPSRKFEEFRCEIEA